MLRFCYVFQLTDFLGLEKVKILYPMTEKCQICKFTFFATKFIGFHSRFDFLFFVLNISLQIVDIKNRVKKGKTTK